MLETLKLTNFRCFKEYEVDFNDFNVIVGKNNTGKSTIVDALKLVANICRYGAYRDHYLEERDIPFSQVNINYDYNDEDVIIQAQFTDNILIEVIFPYGERPFVNIPSISREKLRNLLGVIPSIGTFEEEETIGDPKYLRSILVSHLTARHFRNIWYILPDDFDSFQQIIETTWHGYNIEIPEIYDLNKLRMFFTEYNIPREICWAGHGFQAWLQLMTFIIKLGRVETLVLDEPDIYLHSDMQKKLVNVCKDRSNQVIIATHAIDIIDEVGPEDIISIDKNSVKSHRLSDIDEVQTCITQLGSNENLKLVQLYRGKTCLFVEGNDFSYLKIIANKLNYQSFARQENFTCISLGGFSNWDRLKDIQWLFRNAVGELVKCYVILDRDYHSPDEINEISKSLYGKGVQIHFWEKKELENYAINFQMLYRAFQIIFKNKHKKNEKPISYSEFEERLLSILDEFKLDVSSQHFSHYFRRNQPKDIATIHKNIMSEFEDNWKNIKFRINVIPGKDFFAKLNNWLTNEHQLSVSVSVAFNYLRKEEIDEEIEEVIREFTTLINKNSKQ